MKLKKLTLVLVVVLMASTLAPVFAKSPFADVPADHWAYDSIVELAAAGLIEGYPDGTFGGSRMMTRYEAAMVFARALTRLEGQIADTDVLPELDKIKADLMAEIKAQMAALDKPVVETKVVEKVVVDRDVDEATLDRIRANEIAAEALEGDIAYVEARVLGLIDGIRYDVNKLQEQVDAPAVEQPSMEEIEALIAAKVQEGILEAALSAKEVVKETTVVERVVSTTPELTEEDVELIAQAMIAQQLQQYELLIVRALRENAEQSERLDALEAAQADLATKEELTEVKTAVKALEKVKFGGTLKLTAENKEGAAYKFEQTADLSLNIKASDTVNVKGFLGAKVAPHTKELGAFTKYGVEVTSQSPMKRLVVGTVSKDDVGARFSSYVLNNTSYGFAGLADLDIIEGLSGNVLLGQKASGDPVKAGLALSYKLSPAIGIKGSVVAEKPAATHPKAEAVGAGIFGEIAKIQYAGDFAMDLRADEANTLFAASLKTKLGPVSLDGKYVTAAEKYAIADPFVKAGAKNSVEAGAGLEFLGIDLGGRYYRESADAALVSAYKLNASKGFEFVVPFTVSATYVANTDEVDTQKKHAQAKLAIGPEKEPDLGFFYGASLTYAKNEFNADGNWKNGDIGIQDAATVAGNVKYKVDYRGALVDLGYGATLRVPTEPEGDKVLTHKVDLGYGFTKDVKLTFGSTIKQTLAEEVQNTFSYNAGLSVKF